MCMYVGSDVSLVEYLCTHVCLNTVAEENVAPFDGFYVDLDIDEELDAQVVTLSL